MEKENHVSIKTYLAIGFLMALPVLGVGCKTADKTSVVNEPGDVGGAVAVGECQNPFYPLSEGYSLSYRHLIGGNEMKYGMTVTDVSDSSATTEFTFDDMGDETEASVTFSQVLKCDNGTLAPQGYLDMSSALGEFKMKTETREVSGVLLPAGLAPGDSWQTSYELVVTPEEGGYPAAQYGEMKTSVRMESKVLSSERVEVPAGGYDAMKVESVMFMTTDIPGLPGDIPPTETKVVQYQWWVEGVGMVKSEGGDGSSVTELISVGD